MKGGKDMSKRHKHRQVVLPPTIETRAHAHGERHRVNTELHLVTNMVSHGIEPDDVIEPGPAWKPLHPIYLYQCPNDAENNQAVQTNAK